MNDLENKGVKNCDNSGANSSGRQSKNFNDEEILKSYNYLISFCR